jgi:choline kinase
MKPTLVILAAGMGSRYGELKQIDGIGPNGERIIDYSIYDALRAGFGKIVFIIRKSIEKSFKETILSNLPDSVNIEFVYQELDAIPEGLKYSPERVKPWGTGHALLVTKDAVHEPFIVINADDFYGAGSYKIANDFLSTLKSENEYGLIGYKLKNTLSDFGSVSRGICDVDENNHLVSIKEMTKIEKNGDRIFNTSEEGSITELSGDEIVSMNMFAFTPSVFKYYERDFKKFINENYDNPKAEFYIPTVIDGLIKNNEAEVSVVKSDDSWFGLTYSKDKEIVQNRINELISDGVYPEKLWG